MTEIDPITEAALMAGEPGEAAGRRVHQAYIYCPIELASIEVTTFLHDDDYHDQIKLRISGLSRVAAGEDLVMDRLGARAFARAILAVADDADEQARKYPPKAAP